MMGLTWVFEGLMTDPGPFGEGAEVGTLIGCFEVGGTLRTGFTIWVGGWLGVVGPLFCGALGGSAGRKGADVGPAGAIGSGTFCCVVVGISGGVVRAGNSGGTGTSPCIRGPMKEQSRLHLMPRLHCVQ